MTAATTELAGIRSRRGWQDVVLAAFVLQWGGLGAWAVLAPRAFYDDFPGLGRTWISVDGPYNEHLLRDVGGLFLAVAAVSAVALWKRTTTSIRTAGIATVVFSVPHVTYHAAHTDLLDATDAVASVGSLAFGLLLGVALVVRPGGDERG